MTLKTEKKSSYRSESDELPKAEYFLGESLPLMDGDERDELLLLENPYTFGGWFIAHMTEHSERSQSGFVQSQMDIQRLSHLLEHIDSCEKTFLLLRKVEQTLELWSRTPDEKRWKSVGALDIIPYGLGRVAQILSFKIEMTGGDESLLEIDPVDFSQESIRNLVVELEKKQKAAYPAKIRLQSSDEGCDLLLISKDDDTVLHTIQLTSSADLIYNLRLPSIVRSPILIDKGFAVQWDIFNDIDYGEYPWLRPFVETGAPKEVMRRIPVRISDVNKDYEEVVHLVLLHDQDVCPIVHGTGKSHERCWRIKMDDSFSGPRELRNGLFTGREVFGHLSGLHVWDKSRLYQIEPRFEYEPGEPLFYVYQEDTWIRRLLRERGIVVRSLPPGTFLRIDEEEWTLTFTVTRVAVEWTATSSLTGEYLRQGVLTFLLESRLSAAEIVDSFVTAVAEVIPLERIRNKDEAIDLLVLRLGDKRYDEKPPECKLEIERDGKLLRMCLYMIGGATIPTRLGEEKFKVTNELEKEGLIEAISYRLEDGDLSEYNIVNVDEFFGYLEELLDELK